MEDVVSSSNLKYQITLSFPSALGWSPSADMEDAVSVRPNFLGEVVGLPRDTISLVSSTALDVRMQD